MRICTLRIELHVYSSVLAAELVHNWKFDSSTAAKALL